MGDIDPARQSVKQMMALYANTWRMDPARQSVKYWGWHASPVFRTNPSVWTPSPIFYGITALQHVYGITHLIPKATSKPLKLPLKP